MFSFKPLLVGLTLATLSSSAFALTTIEQRDYDRLVSGDLTEVKKAAQSIVANNTNNAQVLDVLAEFVAQNYLHAPDYQLDTIAWACRALGETGNPRYRELLTSIVNSDAHKKVRKYAKRSLKSLPSTDASQYVVGSIDLKSIQKAPATNGSSLTGDDKAMFDIASGNLIEIKMLAQKYTTSGIPSQQVGDTLAEYFAQNYKTGQQHQYDTLAWICKGLATDKNGRYKALIEDAEENSPIRAVRKHCPDEIEGKGPYYQAGTVDLVKVEKQLQ
ncbi:HEAT repeat domain-containing protein [Pseudoalteromonas shioyasakiensis]|uniref:HEAT repeat domain-containing protein n=1 Tax=Pseudoalteromonas shioyasakiensis TaxID=1190813 RepID=UPI0021174160|nr:HEAT repeat domain-containing protein [Pseudoalteromonas shioyasakiensis]MCQ8878467.1 HEAT repeat domain-containing protein [Pseudoalteromonas shioyasakiensis]